MKLVYSLFRNGLNYPSSLMQTNFTDINVLTHSYLHIYCLKTTN